MERCGTRGCDNDGQVRLVHGTLAAAGHDEDGLVLDESLGRQERARRARTYKKGQPTYALADGLVRP